MAFESLSDYEGFLVPTKTLLVDAAKAVFDESYSVEEFRNLHTSIEYPDKPQAYPGLWVDFNITGQVEVAGIGHIEIEVNDEDENDRRKLARWRFEGGAVYTCVALSSLERDRLVDRIVMLFAGWEGPGAVPFRSVVESNEFIAIDFNFDQATVSGLSASPGTPWGTDDILYEGTVTIRAIGEFVIDLTSGTIIDLSAIELFEYVEGEPDPLPGEDEDHPWF